MVEVVIKLPDNVWEEIVKEGYVSHLQDETVAVAVAEGIALPKFHGRLIDELAVTRHAKSVQTLVDMHEAPAVLDYAEG